MDDICTILDSLESTTSRLEKEAILRENADCNLLKLVLTAGLDPYTNYYVSKFKKPKAGASAENTNKALYDFIGKLEKLSTREITGNAAKEYVHSIFSDLDERLQKWAERIILKNLRIGIQGTTVNKIWPGTIQSFDVALADTLDANGESDSFTLNEPVKFPVYVEPKLDGLRLIAIKESGKVTMFTRNGTLLDTLPTIQEALESAPYDNTVLDGEIMGKDWNESASIVMSYKKQKDDTNMILHVFDCVSLEEWKNQRCELEFSGRHEKAYDIVDMIKSKNVQIVRSILTNDEDALRDLYIKYLDKGFEGVMLKDPNAMYAWKRSKAILKLKPFCTHEGVVVGWYKGGVGTKRENDFGGFEVKLPNGVVTRVGSGFTDALKSEINGSVDSYIGRIVECQAQPPLTEDGCMRFPVFIRFRSESDVSKEVIEIRNSILSS